MSTSPDVLNGEFAILPTFTWVELPAPDSTPFAASDIDVFFRLLGTLSVELVSPAFVSVIVLPSKLMPKSLFKNLFVLVWPVPPTATGTVLFIIPFAWKPVVTLDWKLLTPAIPSTVGASPPPALFNVPSAFVVIDEFLRADGTVSVELVSPAFVRVLLVPSKLIPKSLFRNLFVFVCPVPPTDTGTVLFIIQFAWKPVVTLDLKLLTPVTESILIFELL